MARFFPPDWIFLISLPDTYRPDMIAAAEELEVHNRRGVVVETLLGIVNLRGDAMTMGLTERKSY